MELLPGYTPQKLLGYYGSGNEIWKAIGPDGVSVLLQRFHLSRKPSVAQMRALEIVEEDSHPNVLGMLEYWLSGTDVVVALEYAEHTLLESLRNAVAEGLAGVPRHELVHNMLDAAAGIDFLNERQVRYLDVTPQTLWSVGKRVKVAYDHTLRWCGNERFVETGRRVTPAYSAPECLLGRVSNRSPQFSLAAIYYHLRVNHLPYNNVATRIRCLGQPADLKEFSKAEATALARAMANEPEERWPSCRAFAESLAETVSE